MNVDDAMAVGRKEKPDWYFNANEAAPILAAEVERLRAELAAAKAASTWKQGEARWIGYVNEAKERGEG